MTNFYTHNDPVNDSPDFLSKAEIPWNKSKEEVWNELLPKLEFVPEIEVRRIYPVWARIGAAAAIILLLAIPAFMRFYLVSVSSPAGKHITISLPDGSTVAMNASSNLSYHPYWWQISRKIKLSGEAFFEVRKGKKFEVVSELGKTSVLGTSFNIYSRNSDYKVTCFTGTVKVVPLHGSGSETNRQEVILKPNDRVTLTKGGSFTVERNQVVEPVKAWVNNEFVFTSTPFIQVIEDIERQYGVTITIKGNPDYLYTGNFPKDTSVENVLTLVCRPFDIRFSVNSKGEYQIIQNN
jgi:transmembrane sensor